MNSMLQSPVSDLKGVGEEKQRELEQLGITTINDLLHHFPYRYENHEVVPIEELKHQEKVTITGEVQSEPSVRFFGKKKSRMTVRILIDHLLVTAVFFNRAFLKKQIEVGRQVTITGKWDKHRLTISVQDFRAGAPDPAKQLEPIYSVAGSLTVKQMQRMQAEAIKHVVREVPENLPEEIRERYRLPGKPETFQALHQPKSREQLKHARRRYVYEELLFFQLKMQMFKRMERQSASAQPFVYDAEATAEFEKQLPFPLTNAQKRVVREILEDIEAPIRMNRLLQGDVGSGKTVVASIAMQAVFTGNAQSALMVPTEILAEQHYDSLQELFAGTEVTVGLLTGSMRQKEKRNAYERITDGTIDIIIGTHALIQEPVQFHNLKLVITDEQHRFGVGQRRILKEKGEDPDVLFMTATPIPRTLAISVYGDMDVSVIDEMPPGRKPIETYWAKPQMLERVLRFVQKEIDQGRQAYVICPLIEESEALDVQNAIDVHAQLMQFFPGYNVGLMHGRLPAEEKEDVMQRFAGHELDILVSTTVVEVGVNVQNATMMVIYDAERFGLSQLHQLRGRVGRGEHQSYCVLLADPKSETGQERMNIMQETEDGFVLSEKDLELRGPGDFFGKKQSGLPEFKIADVVHDFKALETARDDAAKLIRSEVFWKDEKYRALREYLDEAGAFQKDKLD